MRIAAAPDIIRFVETRTDAAADLAKGEPVVIEPGAHDPHLVSVVAYPPDVTRQIALGRAAVGSVNLEAWNLPGMAIGGVAGSMAGLGVAMVTQALRAVLPHNVAMLEAGFALIGAAGGAAVGSGALELEGKLGEDGKPVLVVRRAAT